MSSIHAYSDVAVAGGVDGVQVSEAGALTAPLAFKVAPSASGATSSSKIVAIRCSSGYKTAGPAVASVDGSLAQLIQLSTDGSTWASVGAPISFGPVLDRNMLIYARVHTTSAITAGTYDGSIVFDYGSDLVAIPPAAASFPFTDAFEASAGALSVNWMNRWSGGSVVQDASGNAHVTPAAGGAYATFTGSTLRDGFISGLYGGGYATLIARSDKGNGPHGNNGYFCWTQGTSLYLMKCVAGQLYDLTNSPLTLAVTAGMYMKLECVGSSIKAYTSVNGTDWTERIAATDSTFSNAGGWGMGGAGKPTVGDQWRSITIDAGASAGSCAVAIAATGKNALYRITPPFFGPDESNFGSYDPANYRYGTVFLFENVPLPPQGSTISTASISNLVATASDNSAKARIAASNTISPSMPTDAASCAAAFGAMSTVYVNWDTSGSWAGLSAHTTPDITAVLQALVDKPGRGATVDVLICIQDWDNRSATGDLRTFYNYANGAQYAPVLNATWT